MELNPVGETDLSDPGKRRNIGRSPDETEIVPPAGTLISRRRLLGQAGKALYLAPTLTVIGLAPKIAEPIPFHARHLSQAIHALTRHR